MEKLSLPNSDRLSNRSNFNPHDGKNEYMPHLKVSSWLVALF
jgi:hypothetical protein